MISVWWLIPAVTSLIGVFVLGSGFRRLGRAMPMSGLLRLIFGVGFLGVGLATALLGFNLHTFKRLSHERVVATITFEKTADRQYNAHVVLCDDIEKDICELNPPTSFVLKGEDWQVEARVLKWKPMANVVGYDSIYRLERIIGRYRGIEDHTANLGTGGNIHTESPIDISVIIENAKWLNAGDAVYGSGVYAPMADEAQFNVFITQDALITRPANEAADMAVAEWTG